MPSSENPSHHDKKLNLFSSIIFATRLLLGLWDRYTVHIHYSIDGVDIGSFDMNGDGMEMTPRGFKLQVRRRKELDTFWAMQDDDDDDYDANQPVESDDDEEEEDWKPTASAKKRTPAKAKAAGEKEPSSTARAGRKSSGTARKPSRMSKLAADMNDNLTLNESKAKAPMKKPRSSLDTDSEEEEGVKVMDECKRGR